MHKEEPRNNIAFVDGQNLDKNTKGFNWVVDLKKFYIYLTEKYKVSTAYYFIGSTNDKYQHLYETIQRAGFILVFRAHSQDMLSKKKGNVDTDIVFSILSKIIDQEPFDKVVLVSGDGDYFRTVQYLIQKEKFAKLLAPNRKSASSLYRPFTPKYVAFLDAPGTKEKIKK